MEEWETLQGGGVKAVGAGAGITGYGADLIIIDDPIKSRAAATVEVDPPGSGLFTSRIFDNCRAMARLYAGKRNISVSVR